MEQFTSTRRAVKALVLGMVSAGCLALMAPARADPVTFLPAGTDVQFKYNNLETIVSNVGDVLTGIFSISSIGNTSGSLLYWGAGISDGTILTGFFTGLTVAEILPTAGGNIIYFTGGTLTMYNVPVGSYN